MLEIAVAVMLGMSLGILSGVVPGLSPSKMLLLAAALITMMTPLQMATVYITMMVVSQYVDAIPAMYLGIPGEISAIPAANESKNLHRLGLVSTTIKLTAVWRIFGTMLAAVLTWLLLDQILDWPQIFSVKVQMALLIIAMIGIWLTAGRGWSALGLMLAGYLLGSIGFHFYLQTEVMTLGIGSLYDGLPLVAVVMGLYVTPQVFKIEFNTDTPPSVRNTNLSWHLIWQQRVVGLVSSVQGFIVGIVPGMSFVLSSTTCYNTAKYYRPNDPASAVVASETGTTTGILSSLIPLLLFGIPITLSESIIFNYMIESGAVFAQGRFLFDNITVLLCVFVLANVIALTLSWPLAPNIIEIFRSLRASQIRALVVGISVFTVVMLGWHEKQLVFYMTCYAVLVGIGFLLRRMELLPLIFMFVLQDSLDHAAWTLAQII